MSTWDIVWIFFMLSALHPILQQKLLETTRRRLIGRMERQRGSQKPLADIDDQTLILADQAEKAIMQVRESVRELISERHPVSKADELALLLSEGIWTHDYPITFRKAQALGLPVTANMPGEVLELMRLFPQPTRRTPTVEYLPVPRRSGDPDRRR